MTETVLFKSDFAIRLTDERWFHVTEEHSELAGLRFEVLEAIAGPDRIIAGSAGELLALRAQPDGKVLVAVPREMAEDGFVITAFLTRHLAFLNEEPKYGHSRDRAVPKDCSRGAKLVGTKSLVDLPPRSRCPLHPLQEAKPRDGQQIDGRRHYRPL